MSKTSGPAARVVRLTLCCVLLVLSISDASSQVSAGASTDPVPASHPVGSTYLPIDNWAYPAHYRLESLDFLNTAFLGLRPWTPAQQNTHPAYVPYGPQPEYKLPDHYGSTYIPLDSRIYPAMTRLYGMGFTDTFVGMRPWTRRSVLHVLQDSEDDIIHSDNEQAQDILDKILAELSAEVPDGNVPRGAVYGLKSAYTRFMGIRGTTLRDSFHLGQTINNDYGRPYQTGFNNITGASTVNEWGRFSVYVRGEYQHSPGGSG